MQMKPVHTRSVLLHKVQPVADKKNKKELKPDALW